MELFYELIDDVKTGCFVVYDNDSEIGKITFQKKDDVYTIDHTFVDEKYRGNKIANELLRLVVDYAIEHNAKIIPQCPFAGREFSRIPEYREIEYIKK